MSSTFPVDHATTRRGAPKLPSCSFFPPPPTHPLYNAGATEHLMLERLPVLVSAYDRGSTAQPSAARRSIASRTLAQREPLVRSTTTLTESMALPTPSTMLFTVDVDISVKLFLIFIEVVPPASAVGT